MSFFKDFRDFLFKGNALDLAVGVIVATAFGAVVNSLVKDVIMPPIGLALGGVDFSNLYLQLNKAAVSVPKGLPLAEAQKLGAVALSYGNFIMTIITFIVVAFSIFVLIRAITKAKETSKKEVKTEDPTTKVCPFCQTEINIKATRCPNCTSQLAE
ncbi:MAG TPA: large conductance mechanosensitive channel protein MscL [Anaerolineaceae bacterium]|nr:large conductance mechanosensitive channel protein MscL [Anaerolineaceae bacterium]